MADSDRVVATYTPPSLKWDRVTTNENHSISYYEINEKYDDQMKT